jgi:hypothetical protein
MSEWLKTVYLGVTFLGSGVLTWIFGNQLGDLLGNIWIERKFRKDLRGAIKHSQPQWDQLVEIAQSRHLNQRAAYSVARSLLRDVLTGTETELVSHRKLLEDYIAKYKAAEPFEGLPSETRVHLERLREALNGQNGLLDPLTAQIRELVSVYEKDKSRQRQYTFGGFVVGVGGLVFAAYAYFNPYTPNVEVKAAQSVQSQRAASPLK